MNELNVSCDFTIEDIHKVREYNYARRKSMTFDEYRRDISKNVEEGLNIIEQLKHEEQFTSA